MTRAVEIRTDVATATDLRGIAIEQNSRLKLFIVPSLLPVDEITSAFREGAQRSSAPKRLVR